MINFFKSKLTKNNKYNEYLEIQRDRSLSKYHNVVNDLEKKRKDELYELIFANQDIRNLSNALVVGCRNSYELDLLESKGVKNVVGVDLFSFDKRIKIVDMHNMDVFNDCSFELIISSHSLEHSYDYKKVLSEFFRVSKSGGLIVIEVPVNYKTQGADIHDFKSSEYLFEIIKNEIKIDKILFSANILKEDNNSGTDVSKVIFSVQK